MRRLPTLRRGRRPRLQLGALLLGVALAVATAEAGEFLAGADISHAGLFEAAGRRYRDGGPADDLPAILARHGLNCARLRLYVGDAERARQDPYDCGNTLDYTLPLAVRVKKAGLQLMLDFHYSDTWADPGHQQKPAAWKDLGFDALEQRMYEYNRDTIRAFLLAGALPDFVQVGNEITPGLLWPDGRVGGDFESPEQWAKLGRLLKAAIRGIRETAGAHPPRIVIHIDRGGDWKATRWFFDRLRAERVEFDIVGQSFYPFWHGTLDQLGDCLVQTAERYGKPVMVVETAFPWVAKDRDGRPAKPVAGIDPGIEGQVAYLRALAARVRDVPGGKGAGIFWWGAEFQPLPGTNLGGYEGKSLFDREGQALPALDVLGRLTRP